MLFVCVYVCVTRVFWFGSERERENVLLSIRGVAKEECVPISNTTTFSFFLEESTSATDRLRD